MSEEDLAKELAELELETVNEPVNTVISFPSVPTKSITPQEKEKEELRQLQLMMS